MFRKGLLFSILTICTVFLKAQTFEWANNTGGDGQDIGRAIASDEEGNTYFTGRINDTVVFANDTFFGKSYAEIIIGKHTKSGKEVWANKVNATAFAEGLGIILDDSANIYITGEFSDTTIFNKTDTLIPKANIDLFLAKYDTSGNLKWVTQRGSNGTNAGNGLAFHDSFWWKYGG
jgi:Tfp pilus assembly protein PilZ